MKTLKVYGASDDLIECSGIDGCEEFNSYANVYMGMLKLSAGGKRVNIVCIYDGSWAFAVCPQNGDYDEMPDWKIARTFGQDVAHSETLTIELPDDAKLNFKRNG
jgi:hypothetical protein